MPDLSNREAPAGRRSLMIEEGIVVGLVRKVLRGVWEYPVPRRLTAVLLGLIGLGGTLTGRFIWGWYHFKEAQRALDRRDFAQAQAHLERCLEVRSNSAETNFLAARTARRAGNFDVAERYLKTSQRLGELPERIDLERALLRTQRGDLTPQILEKLRGFAEQDHPDSILILESLAKYYIKTYQMTQALGYLNSWLQRQPDDTAALLWRGEVHERLFKLQDALEDFSRAVALDPDQDEARQHLAEGLVTAHQPESALPNFEYLLQRQPENPALLLGQARCRQLLNQPEAAKRLLDKLLSIAPNDAAAMSALGRLAQAMGRPDEAEDWLRRAWKLAPYEEGTNYALYLTLTQPGNPHGARQVLG